MSKCVNNYPHVHILKNVVNIVINKVIHIIHKDNFFFYVVKIMSSTNICFVQYLKKITFQEKVGEKYKKKEEKKCTCGII